MIEAMRPAEVLIELVKLSFLLDVEAHDMLSRHFEDLTRLAELGVCYRLDYPRDYAGSARCTRCRRTSGAVPERWV